MLNWLLSPTGERILIKDAINGALDEYYPRPYIMACVETREWKWKPSTTQLINGSRQEYLKILTPYALDPDDQTFRISGTLSHYRLEKFCPSEHYSEIHIPNEEVSGICDYLEKQKDGTWHIVDYKRWGSFKIAKALGLKKATRQAFDENNNPILYKKSGRWGEAGTQKKEDFFIRDEKLVDVWEAELQLNRYRWAMEKAYNISISKMYIFVMVRDGNTVVAKNRGIEKNAYYIPIKKIDNKKIIEYFDQKKNILLDSLYSYYINMINTHKLPSNYELNDVLEKCEMNKRLLKGCSPGKCSEKERWNNDIRCKYYCPVSEICHEIG